jgi:hypothetical protein
VPRLIDGFPFFPHQTQIAVGTGFIEVPAFVPFVWVSVTRPDATAPGTTLFPALIDTGCTSALIIREEHLELVGTPKTHFPLFPGPPAKATTSAGGTILRARLQAKLWLHPHSAGNAAPLDLQITWGITVHELPRKPGEQVVMPLLGAMAFRGIGLTVTVDYQNLTTTIVHPGMI